MSARYRDCRLDGFSTAGGGHDGLGPEADQLVRAKRECERYVEQFLEADGNFATSGLLFIGRTGSGKTHLAVAVLRELIVAYGVKGRFVDFTDLIHQIQATFAADSSTSKSQILEPLRDVDVLVLDELGAQKPSPFVQDVLYLVINARYAGRLPTLFTSNYDLPDEGRSAISESSESAGLGARALGGRAEAENLSHRIQSPLVSRLYEMARPIWLSAVADYRREIQMQRHRV